MLLCHLIPPILSPVTPLRANRTVESGVHRMCAKHSTGSKLPSLRSKIVNFGHGITPGVDPYELKRCVQKYSDTEADP